MRVTHLIAATIALTLPAHAAETNTTAGECSPIVTNNQSAVTIECKGMSEQIQKQLVEILNSILRKQLDPAAVMAKLDEIANGMGELKNKSVDAERGIISIYDFNGAQRIQSAGRVQVIAGDQVVAFQKMAELEKTQQWQALLDLCEQQITAAPKWLTAYLVAGEAYAYLGDKTKAVDRLQYVVQHAGSDPAYKGAAAMIEQLRAAPQ